MGQQNLGGGYQSVRERFENGIITPHLDSNVGSPENGARAKNAKWTGSNPLSSQGAAGRKASNSHVGNPLPSPSAEGGLGFST